MTSNSPSASSDYKMTTNALYEMIGMVDAVPNLPLTEYLTKQKNLLQAINQKITSPTGSLTEDKTSQTILSAIHMKLTHTDPAPMSADLMYALTIMYQIEKEKIALEKTTLYSSAQKILYGDEWLSKTKDDRLKLLTKSLDCVNAVINSPDLKTLVPALEALNTLEKTLPNTENLSSLKSNLTQLGIAGAILIACCIYVTIALKVPFMHNIPQGLNLVSSALNMPIPGLANLITFQSMAVNTVIGIAGAYALKAGVNNYQTSRYNNALNEINNTLSSLNESNNPVDQAMVRAAENALIDIKVIQLKDDKSTRIHELTTALKMINKTLKNPEDWDVLQSAALCGENLPPKVQHAYFKYLAPLVIVIGVATCITAITLASTSPLLQPLVSPIMSLGTTMSKWGMTAVGWQIPLIPETITGGALFPQMVVSKLAGFATMSRLDSQDVVEAKKLSYQLQEKMLNTLTTELKGNPLLQTMKTFKDAYEQQREHASDYINNPMHSSRILNEQTTEPKHDIINPLHSKPGM